MKKMLIPVLVLVGIICLGVTACPGIGYVVGTGPVVDQTYDFTDFKNIEISNAFGFEITQSDKYSLTISTHENIIKYLDIKKSGDTLIVRMKPGSYTNSETRASISLPDLVSLQVSGASKGSLKGFKSANDLNITSSGASQLDIDIQAGRTRLEISGASKVKGSLTAQDTRILISGASRCDLDGSASSCDIELSGASNLYGTAFKMLDGTVSVSGASHARIFTSGTLNIEASGASTVTYSGDPKIKGLNVSGASHVGSE